MNEIATLEKDALRLTTEALLPTPRAAAGASGVPALQKPGSIGAAVATLGRLK